MKSFETLLQNACEDYLAQFNKEPTLDEIAEICNTHIANVVWKALRSLDRNKKYKQLEKIVINNLLLEKIEKCFNQICKTLLNKQVSDKINTINYMFKICTDYGFDFYYGTRNGLHTSLVHDYGDKDIIIGAGFSKKIKNNKILSEKR